MSTAFTSATARSRIADLVVEGLAAATSVASTLTRVSLWPAIAVGTEFRAGAGGGGGAGVSRVGAGGGAVGAMAVGARFSGGGTLPMVVGFLSVGAPSGPPVDEMTVGILLLE
jgi:hypothetical protein